MDSYMNNRNNLSPIKEIDHGEIYHPRFGCRIKSVSYDFKTKTGKVFLPTAISCFDGPQGMRPVLNFFLEIDIACATIEVHRDNEAKKGTPCELETIYEIRNKDITHYTDMPENQRDVFLW